MSTNKGTLTFQYGTGDCPWYIISCGISTQIFNIIKLTDDYFYIPRAKDITTEGRGAYGTYCKIEHNYAGYTDTEIFQDRLR